MRDPTTRRALVASTTAAVRGCALRRIVLPVISVTLGVMAPAVATEPREHLHFTVNLRGDYTGAASAGFNLADVSTQSALSALPEGMKGVYWLGNGYNSTCSWRLSDKQITETVMAIKDNRKFSGIYYISDEPHPALCPDAPQRLAERTALIHSLDPRGKTFVVVLNSSTAPTEFAQMKDSADYIGVDPYPCNVKNELTGCNYTALRQRIDQALAAGIPSSRIVPVFQTFGQVCTSSGHKLLPIAHGGRDGNHAGHLGREGPGGAPAFRHGIFVGKTVDLGMSDTADGGRRFVSGLALGLQELFRPYEGCLPSSLKLCPDACANRARPRCLRPSSPLTLTNS